MLVVPPEGDGGKDERDEGLEAARGLGLRIAPSRTVAAAQGLRARVEARRESIPLVGATLDVIARDSAIGGGILAGALAYRLFFFLLPLGLVSIGILGLISDATGRSPANVGEATGMSVFVTASVARAAEDDASWYAILVGIPVLIWVSNGLVRVLGGVHRLAWGVAARGTRASLGVSVVFTASMLGLVPVVGLAIGVLDATGVQDLVGLFVLGVALGGAWLALTWRLPHPGAPWTALLPGAAMFGLGAQVLHAFNEYVVAELVESKQDAYGVLGVAAALLFGLYLTGRLIVATAVLDATLWGRQAATSAPSAQGRSVR